jgi:hypothetical protein
LTGLTFGDITGVSKKGWEHLWVYTVQKKVETPFATPVYAQVPKYVYVEKVYETNPWTTIGL